MPSQKESKQGPPASKLPVPKRGPQQTKVTTQAVEANLRSKVLRQAKVPQTDEKKMDVLRSKLEHSLSEFLQAKKELEEVLSAGGSSEQGRPVSEAAAAELNRELQRHRDLTSKVKLHLMENRESLTPGQDKPVPANSYEFLKSIMG